MRVAGDEKREVKCPFNTELSRFPQGSRRFPVILQCPFGGSIRLRVSLQIIFTFFFPPRRKYSIRLAI